MEKNVGTIDKGIRVVLAAVFAYIGFLYSYWLWIIPVLLIITVFTGFCWPYKLFGISTINQDIVRKKTAKKKKR